MGIIIKMRPNEVGSVVKADSRETRYRTEMVPEKLALCTKCAPCREVELASRWAEPNCAAPATSMRSKTAEPLKVAARNCTSGPNLALKKLTSLSKVTPLKIALESNCVSLKNVLPTKTALNCSGDLLRK